MKYISPYNEHWPLMFEQIALYLGCELPGACRIHHVGSTSIPGMPAKDIIDVDIECPPGAMASIIVALHRTEYVHEGDKGIPAREAFRPAPGSRAAELPRHHLYACESGARELVRHLAFRDYLAAHAHRAKWLADEKVSSDTAAHSREAYIEGKSAAYDVITGEALTWADRSADQKPR